MKFLFTPGLIDKEHTYLEIAIIKILVKKTLSGHDTHMWQRQLIDDLDNFYINSRN